LLKNTLRPKAVITIKNMPNSSMMPGSEKADDSMICGIARAALVMKNVDKEKNNKIFNFIFDSRLLNINRLTFASVPQY